ncbi:Gfo/Idh/MocA family oxidoreductase [Aquibacillus sp. 3ASR75-11]|uniref:Gfo/Idh/MocA family oxidoreductase n=1 Tax=Terrihalobacillus insolitus TaxID=2950438 RepID=A0A9X4AKH7_9BACI|nr:Gfo/Idh/MocA family oxidoreductase [Terrihalobacillus insolitus]MDC3412205.1 Gfo/Idh/MocA family oxidoreductase [Terrihalobacillus insolitus]MDC3423101.1 Gfo/Idh/MocA family oxidoreductase [Terrihalobacillus insolitus]
MVKIKWGILSTARIGQKQLIPAIQRSVNGEVEAIASRGEKAKEVASKFNIPKAYTSYEDLLNDDDIDAVYIPLPNSLHKQWVVEAAKHKKHVLCEKPAALHTNELKEMLTECRENGVYFMEAFMYQFHPQHEKVKQVIASGVIGDVSLMKGSFSFVLENDPTNIRLNKDLGGGSLFDVGCYCIHSIRSILDQEPVRVFASAKLSDTGVDTTAIGMLDMENGVKAVFDSSFELSARSMYEIVGSKGTIKVPQAYRPDNNNHIGVVQVIKDDGTVEEIEVHGDQYKNQVEHFAACILENKEPQYTDDKMLNNLKVIEACYQSIEQNASIELQ